MAGRPVWLAPALNPKRKTDYNLVLVAYAGTLVSIDARLPNDLFAEALTQGKVQGSEHEEVRREVTRGASRLDFLLSGPGGVHWVECKSVTLVQAGVALFPDAPTLRGKRHLEELIDAVRHGEGASVAFVVQRADANCLAPHRTSDPEFAETLARALESGVNVLAYRCRVSAEEITIDAEIPVVGV